MAAASAVILDPTPPEMIVEHLRERGSGGGELRARIQELEAENRALARENRELEHELLVARIESGALSPPAEITGAYAARVWLIWARNNHHTDACSCHRCRAARRIA